MVALDLATEKLVNGLVIEASAGTGKTYSVAALVAREIALREELRIGNILITTFTRNAAAELRDRVRRRMVQIADQLDTNSPDDGDAISKFLADDLASRADIIRRLRRAVVEFDTATISTIHAVCNKVLGLAGLSTMQLDGEDATSRLVLEAVNDALVESLKGTNPIWYCSLRPNSDLRAPSCGLIAQVRPLRSWQSMPNSKRSSLT
jgi:exodeoxyribonuclease V beta subunit